MKKDKKVYTILENSALPTKQQKEKILDQILFEYRKIYVSPAEKLLKLIIVYPWRFAFSFSTLQAVICTMIWGTGYTNMILRVFGG
ncbi:hypothetical protein [Ruminiclostridium cellulolyticum]|uniref:Uncharacterized protein n=1 Tax=Ruminiclostridium cellulolyticum (strain ATCC 35319 / DSM 5812 / JCM 6584 / H10) TaxID=394503 RepID=B8I8R1_RUMCH|nr:hypothetical protein [Ruminiclostridium cellulolyticum]ACL75294.1 hypothetical protein Ccel_0928 [Ruminiclostridium cellulolyticum H10]